MVLAIVASSFASHLEYARSEHYPSMSSTSISQMLRKYLLKSIQQYYLPEQVLQPHIDLHGIDPNQHG